MEGEISGEVSSEGERTPKRPTSKESFSSRDRRLDSSRHRSRDGERVEKERRGREIRKNGRWDLERGREREKGSRRNRERSKERDREGYRYMEKGRQRDREEHKRNKVSENYRDKSREKGKDKEIERGRDRRDPGRDQRIVFAHQLSLKADERDLYDFFSKAGKVKDVHLMTEHSSKLSKGVGRIEFYNAMSVPVAIALAGQLLRGQPVLVKPSEGQKNTFLSRTSTASEVNEIIGPHPKITEEQTSQVSAAPDQVRVHESRMKVEDFDDGDKKSGMVPDDSRALVAGVAASNNDYSRISVRNIIGAPSKCLVLKYIFDPRAETKTDFEMDIKEDIEDECSRFGQVNHMFIDKNSKGFMYLRFDNVISAIGAQRALHGRWFAGKMITATFMLPQTYSSKFPRA